MRSGCTCSLLAARMCGHWLSFWLVINCHPAPFSPLHCPHLLSLSVSFTSIARDLPKIYEPKAKVIGQNLGKFLAN